MTHASPHNDRFKLTTAALWCAGVLLFYLFCSGPVTRWSPAVADKLYAPLAPLADSETLGKPLRAWLSLWGVQTGE